jgi:phosphoesterase RecJ-like protein
MKSQGESNQIKSSIINEIEKNQKFLICSHINPDGDAIGSQLALSILLVKRGKEVFLFNRDGVPEIYSFLPFSNRISHHLDENSRFECTFLLDCSRFERVEKGFRSFPGKGKVIVIDHHGEEGGDGHINLIDPSACATGELIFSIARYYESKIPLDIAINLYTAILTDTGSFQFSNSTPSAFEIAGELVKGGVDPRYVAERVYESYSPERFRLLEKVLGTLEITDGGKIGTIIVTRSMLEQTGAKEEMTDGFANLPRSIKGVKVSALFREVSDQLYRVSLRSKEGLNVANIASSFKGGGHTNAAGFFIEGRLHEVKERVLNAIKDGIEGL